eukprot:364830-Chlamydomonas_euryale.AAC.3
MHGPYGNGMQCALWASLTIVVYPRDFVGNHDARPLLQHPRTLQARRTSHVTGPLGTARLVDVRTPDLDHLLRPSDPDAAIYALATGTGALFTNVLPPRTRVLLLDLMRRTESGSLLVRWREVLCSTAGEDWCCRKQICRELRGAAATGGVRGAPIFKPTSAGERQAGFGTAPPPTVPFASSVRRWQLHTWARPHYQSKLRAIRAPAAEAASAAAPSARCTTDHRRGKRSAASAAPPRRSNASTACAYGFGALRGITQRPSALEPTPALPRRALSAAAESRRCEPCATRAAATPSATNVPTAGTWDGAAAAVDRRILGASGGATRRRPETTSGPGATTDCGCQLRGSQAQHMRPAAAAAPCVRSKQQDSEAVGRYPTTGGGGFFPQQKSLNATEARFPRDTEEGLDA